jgi:hypothetical protein
MLRRMPSATCPRRCCLQVWVCVVCVCVVCVYLCESAHLTCGCECLRAASVESPTPCTLTRQHAALSFSTTTVTQTSLSTL